jgi:hypothetical protein
MWSANSMKWVYSPIYYTSSDQLTFIVDFALNLLTIKQENPLLLKDFSMPLGWRNNISSVSNSSDLALGTIGTYGTSNLTEIAELSLMQIEREHNNDISKPELLTNGTSIVSIKNVSKINPSSFEVSLSAISKPFVLVLADLYDPFWIASVNGKNIPSDPIGGGINGFMINETGQLNINIHYEPQKWFGYGLIITSIILLVYTCYLICSSISISHLFKICGMTFPNARRKIGSKFKEFG